LNNLNLYLTLLCNALIRSNYLLKKRVKMNKFFWCILILSAGLLSVFLGHCNMSKTIPLINQITDAQSVIALFPQTPDEIQKKIDIYLIQVKKDLDALIALPDEQRTFANTAQALDTI